MARPKRNSAALARAERRLESLRSIDPTLNLGGGLTVANFSSLIGDLAARLAAYNTTLSTVDKLADDVKATETAVNIMAEKMLSAVAIHYGRNSQEYEMAGGTRRRRRNVPSQSSADESAATATSEAPQNGDTAKPAAA